MLNISAQKSNCCATSELDCTLNEALLEAWARMPRAHGIQYVCRASWCFALIIQEALLWVGMLVMITV